MKFLAALAAVVLLLGAPALSQARPRSINDCETIKDGDAYNKCLASFGPKRGASRSGRGYRPPRGASKRYRRSQRVRPANMRGIRIFRSNGRVRTVIPVGSKRR